MGREVRGRENGRMGQSAGLRTARDRLVNDHFRTGK